MGSAARDRATAAICPWWWQHISDFYVGVRRAMLRPSNSIVIIMHHNPSRPSEISFQILHLLAELLDHALELKADIGQLDVV